MEVVVIENERLTVTIAPMLGGRIVGLRDKVASFDLLDSSDLSLTSGVGFVVDREPFMVATEPCSFQIMEAEEETDQAGVILFGSKNSHSLSWQVAIALKPTSYLVDIKFQFVCRGFGGALENNGIWLAGSPTTTARALNEESYFSHDSARRSTLYIKSPSCAFEHEYIDDKGARVLRMSPLFGYDPRQIDGWNASLGGFAGLDELTFCNERLGFHLIETQLRFVSSEHLPDGKLILLRPNGESVETRIQTYAGKPSTIELGELGGSVTGVAFLNQSGGELLKWESMHRVRERLARQEVFSTESKIVKQKIELGWSYVIFAAGNNPAGAAEMDFKKPATRKTGQEVLGDYAMTQNDFFAAIEHYDRALAYGAEDAILWWKKAYAMRKAGLETDERDELANAHFLSPLEPLLRAEAFLSQPVSSEKGPNPLAAPLAMFPDQMTLVANHLLEIGQLQDAARWIDECLRHREIPILRILWAAMLLKNGAKAEAYDQAKLGSNGIDATERYRPWKEGEALDDLSKAFPDLINRKRIKKRT